MGNFNFDSGNGDFEIDIGGWGVLKFVSNWQGRLPTYLKIFFAAILLSWHLLSWSLVLQRDTVQIQTKP